MTLNDIDVLAVGLGPGAFTSLRVGLSTVKGLAFATKKPVIGIPSMDAIAMSIKDESAQICTICDAKRNLVFGCLYEKNGAQLKKKTDYLLTDINDLLKKIKGDSPDIRRRNEAQVSQSC